MLANFPRVFISVPRLWLKFQHGVFSKMPPKKLDRLLGIPILGRLVARKVLKGLAGQLAKPVEYVPEWVVMGVALCLGIGTMFGWERIVKTVGEKIGKTHLTYAQGGAAELVAATTIAMADHLGMPVSTTHVLSSGVAGTMWANKSGIQAETVREIALAWILTLPVAMALSGGLYWLATWFVG